MEQVLTEICEYLNNYFWTKKARGTFTISGGAIQLPWIKEGQYFRIIGSDLNDGVYTYHANSIMNDDEDNVAGLQDEVFSGTICAMAVPKTFMNLVKAITG